ncbi:MAG: hypothetical protein J0L84_00775 [Verrucomicrobia bacterium]|nr:hypothetical protein [Verrucomicrobiota bacterium]
MLRLIRTLVGFLVAVIPWVEALRAQDPVPPLEETGYFDGRLWNTGVPRLPNMSLAVDDQQRLIVAGLNLGVMADLTADVARWDGRTWTVLAKEASGIETMAAEGSNLYVGGFITLVDGVRCNHVARFDGIRWHAMGKGLGEGRQPVVALAISRDRVYASGFVTNRQGLPGAGVAFWEPATDVWQTMGETFPGVVRSLEVVGDEVYAGGDHQVFRWRDAAWEVIGTVGPDPLLSEQYVSDIQWHGGALYIGGTFGSVNGVVAGCVARWRGGQWESVSRSPIPGRVFSLGFSGEELWLATTTFQGPGTQSGTPLVRLREGAWITEPPLVRPFTSRLVGSGSQLFMAGTTLFAPSANRDNQTIFQFDGGRWFPVNGGLTPPSPPSPGVMAVDAGALLLVPNNGIPPFPMVHDGWGFGITQGVLDPGIGGLRIRPVAAAHEGRAYAVGYWTSRVEESVIAQLEGNTWKPLTLPVPLNPVTRVAVTEGRIAVAGNRAPASGEIWEWNGSDWARLGDSFEPVAALTPTPPTGRESSGIYSLCWHQGRLFAGCAAVELGGQVRSNLVVWNGTQWDPVAVPLSGPATVLHSAANALHVVSYVVRRPSLRVWDGTVAEEIGASLKMGVIHGMDVSSDGVLAVVGTGNLTPYSPVWFRRQGQWSPPPRWTAPPVAIEVRACAWRGNDLYLAGAFTQMSRIESSGLAIWHEPGPRLVLRTGEDGETLLRATGALPERFQWERSGDLDHWTPFALPALGSPGWVSAPGPEEDRQFYRLGPRP